ncbi:exosortase A [Sphingomonas sp. Leaf412]|uniref:exosortase A n=1 Tax=Sphingomonas sp. Leaf412 TaxID=1736370 RepID=UPI0006F3D6C4|nr:exosortase A [Sphingomonas sp. Leaf412]KQT33524.1 exosortase A [Sphingomonas sp. Leaf412]
MWRRHLATLGVVAVLLLILFRDDVADVTHIWWTSTTFGHCLFIAPVVAWLVWTRRREVAALTPVGWLPGLAVVAAGGILWLLGDAGSVALARQLGLLVMLEGAVVACLGPDVARGLAFPLAYAAFMVPFGDGLEPPLQDATVAMVLPMLHVAGVPAVVDGVLIHAGRYWFEVAEACSGAKFVLAMLAYGALVANVAFRGWRRRALFLIACVVVPVLANGVRAFATIYAAHLTSVEAATGLDHIVYGWVFFAIVMAALMAGAWRWFDRSPDAPAFDPAAISTRPRMTVEVVVAGALVLATAAVFPAWSGAIAARAAPLPGRIDLPVVADWTRAPVDDAVAWRPVYPAADHYLFGRYRDAQGRAVDMGVAAFAGQREGRELVAYGTGVLGEATRWTRVADPPAIDGGAAVRIVAAGPGGRSVERVVATWYRVGGIVTASGTRAKIATVRDKLDGGTQTAVALHLSAEGPGAVAAIAAFRRAMGPVDAVVDGIVARRR